MKLVVIINGVGRSGKDTLCNFVADEFESDNFSVVSISSVDKIKQCAKILGWNGCSKSDKDRKFLSDLKDLATQYCDSSFNYEVKMIDKFLKNKKPGIMFIHIREPEEITKLVNRFPDVKTLLVQNINEPNITSNHADCNVENYDYDYYICNNGTLEEFRINSCNFIEDLWNCEYWKRHGEVNK